MWNQMVVKALFIGSTLAPIQKLDERRNADLARMLVDYAHERWAAGRTVSPELWRCVGPFAGEAYIEELLRVFESPSGIERKAAALALAECPSPDALLILESSPALWNDIRKGSLTWDSLG
jgi:HEAT repeat protein